MQKLTDITKNSVEDGVEDFVSSFLFRRMRKLTEPFLKDFDSDSEFDQAMQSFITTLSMGLTLYAYMKIMKIITKMGARFVGLWSYIVAGKIKKALSDKLSNSKTKGKKAFKLLSVVLGADRTAERIEISKMVNQNLNKLDDDIKHYENQYLNVESNINGLGSMTTGLKGSSTHDNLMRYTYKSRTGTWLNTNEDKKLFEKVTGQKIVSSGAGSWASFYLELNKYTEFAKTVDGEILNLTGALNKAMSRSGLVG